MEHRMFRKIAFVMLGVALLRAAGRHGHGPWRHHHGDCEQPEGHKHHGPRAGHVPPFFAEWHRRAHAGNETTYM
jgi:hypothetical protein